MSDSAHILIKEIDAEYAEQFPHAPTEYRYRIECQIEGGCGGWQECDKPHEINGRSADDGPYDCAEGDPWDGEEEFEFHGVPHTWRDGYGWTEPFEGCPVASRDCEPPDGVEDLPPGRYEVTDEWDDTSLYLEYVGPEVS